MIDQPLNNNPTVHFTISDPDDPKGEGVVDLIPEQATEHSAGYDLKTRTPFVLGPNQQCVVPTGLYLNFTGYDVCGLVLPRSGIAVNQGVTVLNSPGLIDPDYTGEVKVVLIHQGTYNQPARFERGDRIAQLVFMPVPKVNLYYNFRGFANFNHNTRGEGGFGSTGMQ